MRSRELHKFEGANEARCESSDRQSLGLKIRLEGSRRPNGCLPTLLAGLAF